MDGWMEGGGKRLKSSKDRAEGGRDKIRAATRRETQTVITNISARDRKDIANL